MPPATDPDGPAALNPMLVAELVALSRSNIFAAAGSILLAGAVAAMARGLAAMARGLAAVRAAGWCWKFSHFLLDLVLLRSHRGVSREMSMFFAVFSHTLESMVVSAFRSSSSMNTQLFLRKAAQIQPFLAVPYGSRPWRPPLPRQ